MEDIAITVNVNPNSFVTIGKERKRWCMHHPQAQSCFLHDNVVEPIESNISEYTTVGYERTQAGNVHVHLCLERIQARDLEQLDRVRNEFLRKLPKMSVANATRCWYQERCNDAPHWRSYCLKEQKTQGSRAQETKVSEHAADPDIVSLTVDYPDEEMAQAPPTKKLF